MKSPTYGPHVVLEELGRGGMGFVYRARHVANQQIVALKVLELTDVSEASLAARERFLREAQVLSHLNHPAIVKMWDSGQANHVCYFAMEMLEGEDLKDHLTKNGVISWQIALEWLISLSSALEHVHALQITHRDIKPANIVLTKSGVKLIDFGLVKVHDLPNLSQTGAIVGTPAYMAPEQIHAGTVSVGPRADIYSLGLTFFTLLTKKNPFRRAKIHETAIAVLKHDYDNFRPQLSHIPEDLAAVLLKCLHRDPELRFQSATELSQELAKIKLADNHDRLSLSSSPNKTKQTSQSLKILGPLVVLLTAVLAIVMFYFVKSKAATETTIQQLNQLKLQSQTQKRNEQEWAKRAFDSQYKRFARNLALADRRTVFLSFIERKQFVIATVTAFDNMLELLQLYQFKTKDYKEIPSQLLKFSRLLATPSSQISAYGDLFTSERYLAILELLKRFSDSPDAILARVKLCKIHCLSFSKTNGSKIDTEWNEADRLVKASRAGYRKTVFQPLIIDSQKFMTLNRAKAALDEQAARTLIDRITNEISVKKNNENYLIATAQLVEFVLLRLKRDSIKENQDQEDPQSTLTRDYQHVLTQVISLLAKLDSNGARRWYARSQLLNMKLNAQIDRQALRAGLEQYSLVKLDDVDALKLALGVCKRHFKVLSALQTSKVHEISVRVLDAAIELERSIAKQGSLSLKFTLALQAQRRNFVASLFRSGHYEVLPLVVDKYPGNWAAKKYQFQSKAVRELFYSFLEFQSTNSGLVNSPISLSPGEFQLSLTSFGAIPKPLNRAIKAEGLIFKTRFSNYARKDRAREKSDCEAIIKLLNKESAPLKKARLAIFMSEFCKQRKLDLAPQFLKLSEEALKFETLIPKVALIQLKAKVKGLKETVSGN